MLFPPEGTSFCQASFASRRLAEHRGAADTQHHGLSVAEHGGDLVATWTFDVHEVGVWTLNETFLLVSPLLLLRSRM